MSYNCIYDYVINKLKMEHLQSQSAKRLDGDWVDQVGVT